jgi:hypothetical protein
MDKKRLTTSGGIPVGELVAPVEEVQCTLQNQF